MKARLNDSFLTAKSDLENVALNINKIQYTELTEEFKQSVRNEITSQRLNYLSELSKPIKIPSLCGTFENELNYLNSLNIMNLCTQETRNRKYFFIKKILPKLHLKKKLLYVGCGDGDITKLIGRSFSEVTVVDINQTALNKVSLLNFKKSTKLIKINRDILQAKLPNCYYNLVVFSHVLYYIEPHNWFNCLTKLYQMLEVNGMLVIVISNGLGKDDIAKRFKGVTLNIDNLINQCLRSFQASFDFFISRETFLAKDTETMFHIANVCLNDVKAQTDKYQLTKYLECFFFCKKDNLYKLPLEQKYIVITKC